jgi:hypothetical protein
LRLAPASAWPDCSTQFPLHHGDEIRGAERAAVGARPVEAVERRLFVKRQLQEIGESRRALQRRADMDQRVIANGKMRAPTLDHGHASGEAASPARTGLNAR